MKLRTFVCRYNDRSSASDSLVNQQKKLNHIHCMIVVLTDAYVANRGTRFEAQMVIVTSLFVVNY